MHQQLHRAVDGGQWGTELVRGHRNKPGLDVVEFSLLLQRHALRLLCMEPGGGIGNERQCGGTLPPFNEDGRNFQLVHLTRLGNAAKRVVRRNGLAAHAPPLPLDHDRYVIRMGNGGKGLGQQPFQRVTQNADQGRVGKNHAAVLNDGHPQTDFFDHQTVALFRFSQCVDGLVALNRAADMVGHKGQYIGILVGVADTFGVALYCQYATDTPVQGQRNAQPAGEGQVASGLRDLTAVTQGDKPGCVDQLGCAGAQDVFRHVPFAWRVVALPDIAITLIDVVGEAHGVAVVVAQGDIQVDGRQQLAHQGVHFFQKVVKRQTRSGALGNPVEDLVEDLVLLLLERVVLGLQGLELLFQQMQWCGRVFGHGRA